MEQWTKGPPSDLLGKVLLDHIDQIPLNERVVKTHLVSLLLILFCKRLGILITYL